MAPHAACNPLSRRSEPLAPDNDFFYVDKMAGEESLSLEELVRQYDIVVSPIAALDLESGMVLRFAGKLRVVISVAFENTGSEPKVIVETAGGLEKFAIDSQLDVWHIHGHPFIVELPPEDIGPGVPSARRGSMPPAHDAAGIVPVWRGPKRLT